MAWLTISLHSSLLPIFSSIQLYSACQHPHLPHPSGLLYPCLFLPPLVMVCVILGTLPGTILIITCAPPTKALLILRALAHRRVVSFRLAQDDKFFSPPNVFLKILCSHTPNIFVHIYLTSRAHNHIHYYHLIIVSLNP